MTEDPGDSGGRLYARSWRISRKGHADMSALRELVEVLVPALEALEGYRGGTLLVDRETGDLVGTTCWDSIEHLEAGHARSRNAASGALVLAAGTSMKVSICEVLLSKPVPLHLAPELRREDT
jgi:hypothetical protein